MECFICKSQSVKYKIEWKYFFRGWQCTNPRSTHRFEKCYVHNKFVWMNMCGKYDSHLQLFPFICPKIKEYLKKKTNGKYENKIMKPHYKGCICIPFNSEMYLTSHSRKSVV